ncbi:MAG: DUF2202 domain-containing protein [Thermoanaerobaculia bacterium]
MKSKAIYTALTIVAVILTATAVFGAGAGARGRGAGQGQNQGGGLGAYLLTLPVEQVSAAETAGLVFTREEEKLARDVYTTLGDKWNLRVFRNIARAEQMHMDAVATMLERYQIADPAAGLAAGEFRDPQLQMLYADLVAKGNTSIVEALKVGATIEDLDIRDLNALVAGSDNQDLDVLYQNLAKGSRNHLRGFIENLKMQSVTYAPQYLDQQTFDAIIGSERERGVMYDAAGNPVNPGTAACDGTGPGDGKGKGKGRGNGTGVCDGSGAGNGGNGNGGNGNGGK